MVLLDNPLSAVDQHTSKHIFDNTIKGLLKDKAVVLIAHQVELLPQVRRRAKQRRGLIIICLQPPDTNTCRLHFTSGVCPFPAQCDKVGIMKAGKMVYFGPPDAEALQEHMPVDSLADATVEAKESAAVPAAAAGGLHAASSKEDSSHADSGSLIKAAGVADDPCLETPEEVCAPLNIEHSIDACDHSHCGDAPLGKATRSSHTKPWCAPGASPSLATRLPASSTAAPSA